MLESPIDDKMKSYDRGLKRVQHHKLEMLAESKKCSEEGFLGQARCDEMYLTPDPKLEELSKAAEANIKVLNEALESKDQLLKQIKYRPIFIDLNDKKTAMGYSHLCKP